MDPRILIFTIAMVADYLDDVKNIDIWAPAFFKHNNSFIATMRNKEKKVKLQAKKNFCFKIQVLWMTDHSETRILTFELIFKPCYND